MSERIMVRSELERVLRTNHDVLLDGYPIYAGIAYHHDAMTLAVALLQDNPGARIQVRLNKRMERIDEIYLGHEEPSLAKVMS